jgi:hypothetical protein
MPGSSAGATSSVTLPASADAYVSSKAPSANFGSAPELRVDGSRKASSNAGIDRTYIRFDVPSTSAPIARAVLRVYATDGDNNGFAVTLASGAWDEHAINWNTAPPFATSPSVASGPFATGTWVSLDVTSLVTQTGSVTLVLTSPTPSPMAFASREQGPSVAPQLVVDTTVAAVAPVDQALPAISGVARAGQLLSATPGTWTGTLPISYGYQWQRCNSSGASCAAISSATASSYTATSLDVGSTLRVQVTASNTAGSGTAMSAATSMVAAATGDTTAPTAPSSLRISAADQTSVTLAWNASTDNVGVTGYDVYLNGSRVNSTTSTSYRFGGLNCGTTYTLGVVAFDAAGNRSSTSTLSTATTACTVNASNPCGSPSAPPTTYQHVVWIVFENHSYSQVIGSTAAPYINSLASKCGLATNFFAEAHPSLPNYIAMTSGSTQGITDDGLPSAHPLSVPSIFSQVGNWRSLEESMPSNCFLTDSYPYSAHHNPAAYYTGIRTACASLDVPLGSTPDTSAAFTFVTPNQCNNMHDCSVSTGDSWLSGLLPTILNSAAYTSGTTAIFITWDEDDTTSNNHIATLVIAPSVPAGTAVGSTFNHYSMLRTTEELLGIGTYLGGAATAPSMRSSFHF